MHMTSRIASVDGASGHIVDATVSLSARGTPLSGAFVTIETESDLMLGRIVNVTMTNPVHSNEMFAPVIMKEGSIPFWSGAVDIERAKIEIVAVLDTQSSKREPIRRNAPSGTGVLLVDQSAINRFLNEQQHMLVLGHIPNSGGLLASMINRHNGSACDSNGHDLGGYGEARHAAILGQSGSAKTVLLTMLLAGRLAAHPQMGLLMPDTSGDLSDPTRHDRGDFRWNYATVLKSVGVEIERIAIDDVRLTSPGTLKFKLRSFFVHQYNVAPEKAVTLAIRVVDALFEDEVRVDRLTADVLSSEVTNQIGNCYEVKNRAAKVADAEQLQEDPVRMRRFERDLVPIRKLFDGRWPLGDLVRVVLQDGRKVIIEMSGIPDSDHPFVMREIMEKLAWRARTVFKAKQRPSNALVVLDEAQNWVPEGNADDDGIGELIQAAFRETRKYGLGWYVVAQSPSGLSKKVLRECHTKWFGRNLGIGADRSHIEDILSKQGAEAYAQLQIQGGYFWVGVGLDSNLGTGATYFTLHPFGGDATTAFIEANPHIFGRAHHVATAAE
jgi:hypothetical protein